MRLRSFILSLVVAAAPGCDDSSKAAEPNEGSAVAAPVEPAASAVPNRSPEQAASPEQVAHGKELVTKYECNRCHEIEAMPAATPDFACAGCHQSIQDGSFKDEPDKLKLYQSRVTSLVHVPSLKATSRFQRAWLAGFLPAAHDVRPNLGPSMPRFRMPPEDATAIASFLAPEAEAPIPALGDQERGRGLIESKGCISCHRFTGVPPIAALPTPVPLAPDVLSVGQKLAPDLRFARDRMRSADLQTWLLDPPTVKPDTVMPNLGLTPEEAADVAAYLVTAPLLPIEYPAVPEALPLLEREVTYAEVHERIFGAICRHCHSDQAIVADGGPGYMGGFGFPVRKLDLSTYAGMRSGSLDDAGKRRSVFKEGPGGKPRIIAHLWARHAEVAGTPVEGVRGMPLGLPPLPAEDIQLLETWIAQGRKNTVQ